MAVDTSSWRLPSFVSLAFHRQDLAESARDARGGGQVLSDEHLDAREGDLVALQLDLRTGAWAVMKGAVTLPARGVVEAVVANVSLDDPLAELLTGEWRVQLVHTAEALADGPWLASSLTSDGVKVIRRTWATPLLDRLVADGRLVLRDREMLPGLAKRVIGAAVPHCMVADPASQANLLARALCRLFEQDDAVEELFVGSADLMQAILEVWAPGDT